MGREGTGGAMKRCGCLFSCQFLLEMFPVRRKSEEEAKERADLKLISHSYLGTRGCRSSVQPSCATVMMVPSPLLWAVRSVSEVMVLYHPSAEACSSYSRCQDSHSPNIHQNSFRTEEKRSLLDRRGLSADWRHVGINANLIKKDLQQKQLLWSPPADQARAGNDTRLAPPRR